MTDILLTNVLGQKSFTWGNGDLTLDGDVRNRYINALILADKNDYAKLMEFVRS